MPPFSRTPNNPCVVTAEHLPLELPISVPHRATRPEPQCHPLIIDARSLLDATFDNPLTLSCRGFNNGRLTSGNSAWLPPAGAIVRGGSRGCYALVLFFSFFCLLLRHLFTPVVCSRDRLYIFPFIYRFSSILLLLHLTSLSPFLQIDFLILKTSAGDYSSRKVVYSDFVKGNDISHYTLSSFSFLLLLCLNFMGKEER